ncbi:hypothetical protein BBJ29_000554 [Phytophthora kernoviae]|uniref:Uncharacterized protein n=1 Tax=Phytophthora kernoviae TaxID=325452 RepID=A0A3R7JCQ2_9STRA|nr:hypothetical protein BBJ29_000554 [Phytophthora kernoviae]
MESGRWTRTNTATTIMSERETNGGPTNPQDDARLDFIRKLVLRTFPTVKVDALNRKFATDSVASKLFDFLHMPAARLLLFTDHGEESSGNVDVYATPPANLFGGASKMKKRPLVTVLYIIKSVNAAVSMTKFHEEIMSGTLEKNALESLAVMLHDVFVPLIGNPRNQELWPEVVTASIINNMHGFFSSLQITLGQTKGATCLPLPWDQVVMESTAKSFPRGDASNPFPFSSSKEASSTFSGLGKDQVHSLEGCLITWTKQIKNILKQDSETLLNNREHVHQGPMEELHFWAAKAKNLNSIFAQLQSDSIRKVLQYLDASKSTYNVPFAKLCKEVFLARAEANDNSHYVRPLAKWFTRLADEQSLPEIRNLFRPICHSILLIWKCSRFYNTPARLVVLIRQICNEIIRKATIHLNGEKLFELLDQGDLEQADNLLQVSLQVCAHFKSIYFDYKAKSVTEVPGNPWRIQNNALFIRLDAFLERCHDVLELTQTIYQFQKLAEMEIGGTKGKTLTTSVHQIYADFQETLAQMKNVQYDLMDLDEKHFEDDFYAFRSKNKELERRLASVINQAFDDAKTIVGRFKCLDCFEDLLDRQIIKNELERKHTSLIASYASDLHVVQQIFIENRESPPISPNLPPFAGAVTWCRGLAERIQFPMEKLKQISPRIVLEREDSKEAMKLYTNVMAMLQEYEVQKVKQWGVSIETSSKAKLKLPLIRREAIPGNVSDLVTGSKGHQQSTGAVPSSTGVFFVNFDAALIQLLREVKYFVLLGLDIPEDALEIYKRAEVFRRQTGNLELIVDMYNTIHATLLPVERPLVKGYLERMDQVLNKGIKALNWKSHGIDVFLKESMTVVNEANTLLSQLKSHQNRVAELLDIWNAPPLLFERKSKALSVEEFEDLQKSLCQQKYHIIKEGGNEIHRLLKDTLKHLRVAQGSPDWRAFVDYVSGLVEDGLARVIIQSLRQLRDQLDPKRIESDDIPALLEVELDLYGKDIVYFPPIQSTAAKAGLQDVIMRRMEAILHCSTVFKRLDNSEGSYLKEMRENVQIQLLVADVWSFLDLNQNACSAFRYALTKYEYLWTTDLPQMFQEFLSTAWFPYPYTDEHSARSKIMYADSLPSAPAVKSVPVAESGGNKAPITVGSAMVTPPPMPAQLLNLERFQEKISFFLSLQNEISESKHVKDVGFVRVNSLPIKQALSTWVTKWVYLFTQYLHDRVVNQLVWVDNFMQRVNFGLDIDIDTGNAEKEKQSLMQCMLHIRDVRLLMREDLLVDFAPLRDFVALLKLNGIALDMSYVGKENVLTFLEQAPIRWENMVNKTFKKKEVIQSLQNQMMESIRQEVAEFSRRLASMKDEFKTVAPLFPPFDSRSIADVYEQLDAYHSKLAQVEQEAARLMELEDIFELASSKNEVLTTLRSNFITLKHIWDFVALLDSIYVNKWQPLLWSDLNVDELMEEIDGLERHRQRLFSSTRSVKGWSVYDHLEQKLRQMTVILPLVKHLHSPAMRRETVLHDLQVELEICQKALNQYLDGKKDIFPRFYFVSNASLLEILSNGNFPPRIQPHFGNCFDGIQSFEFTNVHPTVESGSSGEGELVQFQDSHLIHGTVENWFNDLVVVMQNTLRQKIFDAVEGSALWGVDCTRHAWVLDYPAQVALLGSQIVWTEEVECALEEFENGTEDAIKKYFDVSTVRLEELIKLVQGHLGALDRQKIITLITVDVHARDVVQSLITKKVSSSLDFQWQSQLRYYTTPVLTNTSQKKEVHIKICDFRSFYSYEYIAGSLRRAHSGLAEEVVLMQVLRDFNTPRILPPDYPVFMGLLRDLFPSQDLPHLKYDSLQAKCARVCALKKLQPEDGFLKKIVEYEEVLKVRHSVMLIGPAGCGKSTIWSTLAACHNTDDDGNVMAKHSTVFESVNPKAITADELYGYMTLDNDWKDGVLSAIMRNMSKNVTPFNEAQSYKWVVLDGDIDAVWIESMNTVMDDNKVLTLVSNERIPLTKSMRLVFEISSLINATPATVSRAGMHHYMDARELQLRLEQTIEKRSGRVYGPLYNRKLVYFLDDLNMPSPEEFGTQTALALLRQYMDYNSCDRMSSPGEIQRFAEMAVEQTKKNFEEDQGEIFAAPLIYVDLFSRTIQENVCHHMAEMHVSVTTACTMYAKSYGRHNYVTPTSFLELIRFYRSLLESKRSSQTLKIKRLEVGLATLKKTSLDVAGLQDELKQTMKKVDERKRATELLLEQMGKQRGDAEVKQRRADEERAKAAQAAEIASQIEAQASVELAIAKPALDAAQQAVNCLNKASLTELKSMGKPPAGVEKVTAAVLMMVKKETKNFSWDNAKKMMAKVDVFKQSLEQYDKENIPPDVVARVEPLIQEDPNFNYEKMKSKSVAAANLCVWVVNIISFHQVYVRVKPLMDTLEKARQTKAEADSELAMVQKMVAEVESESIDASLEPVIMRQVYKKGRTWFLQFAGEEIEVDPRFRLYLHTKLPNPHYRPEILAYCTLIDFSVTEKGLEDQLLANVVNLEQPDLETQKRQLQQEFNGYQIQLLMLENDLLERLSNAPEDILSDVPLIEGLEKTKLTAIDVAIALRKGKDTEREINIAREVYRPVANEANVVADVDKLAVKDQERIKGVDYHNIALGQGQEQVAMRTLQMSVESGHWIILNNVHLMPKWMLELDKWLEQLAKASKSTSYATFRNNLSSSNDVARMPTSRSLTTLPPAGGTNLNTDGRIGTLHPNFRLFITSDPSPNIPIGVLERSIKLTNEPPTGLRANVKRAFCCFPKTVVDELEPRTRCILFGLCYFHSLMLERKKFGPQGFNMLYPFAVSDLLASSTVLRNYMDNAPARVPWPDLRYLFGEIMYGGHIVNELDRLVAATYLQYYLRDELLEELSMLPFSDDSSGSGGGGSGNNSGDAGNSGSNTGGDGGDGPSAPGQQRREFLAPKLTAGFDRILEHVHASLLNETPTAFGLHPNAEVAFRTESGNALLQAMLLITTNEEKDNNNSDDEEEEGAGLNSGQGAKETADAVQLAAEGVLQDVLENYREFRFDIHELFFKGSSESAQRDGAGSMRSKGGRIFSSVSAPDAEDMDPFQTVLLQECQRMNNLLEIMTDSLAELELGFRGDVPMTEAMERLQTCLYYERVPDNWLAAACPSRRSLAPWLANLQQRIAQLQEWISSAPDLPLVLWLPGLFNPQAFLTAVLQTAARKHGVELDSLRITADVTKRTVDTVDAPARDGQFVHGLYLEGARWDLGNSVLEGSIPREMYVTMPILTCRAIVNTVNKDSSGGSSGGSSSKQGGVGGTGNIFECPVYRTQQRGPTLIFVSPLRTKVPPAKWVLAGVAMLMEVV